RADSGAGTGGRGGGGPPFLDVGWVPRGGRWAWGPAPAATAPASPPALVAFVSDGAAAAAGADAAAGAGSPVIGWVALGFGEPVVPWWGGPGRIGHAFWGGWGGRHVVNNVVVESGAQVDLRTITRFQNLTVGNAVV